MIKFGELNNISPKLLAQIPKLGPKESAEYRLLSIRKDGENPGQWAIPFAKSIQARMMITDPYSEEIVEIGYVKRIKTRSTKNGPVSEPDIPNIAFLRNQGGRITLHGGNPEDKLLHEYLYLCPLNASSPCKSDNVTPVYDYVDVKANAQKGIRKMNRKLDAMRFISDLTPDKGLFDYAFMVTRTEIKDIDVARFHLGEFAESDPERFFDLVESVDSKVKIIYLRAMSNGIISFEAQTGTVRWAKSQEIICAIPKAVTNREEAFSVWAKASGENMKLVDTIASMLDKKTARNEEPVLAVEETEQHDEPTPTQARRGRPSKEQL